MLAPFASMQLESDLPRFGNPNRFNPVGKCSSSLLKNLEIEALLSSEGPGFW